MNRKQGVFIAEYLIDLNATRAAVAAGYSKRTAESQASRLLRNVKVCRKIREVTNARMKRLEITADRVLQEIAKLAFVDPRKLFNADGSIKPIHEIDANTAAAISQYKVSERKIDLELLRRARRLGRIEGAIRLSQCLMEIPPDNRESTARQGSEIFARIVGRLRS